MTVPQNDIKFNDATFILEEVLSDGNILSQWCSSKKRTIGGRSDTIEISLLSKLWFLYRSICKAEYRKDYAFFTKKFHLSTYQVREAFNIMKRSIGTIELAGRKLVNILFGTLHQIYSTQNYNLIGVSI